MGTNELLIITAFTYLIAFAMMFITKFKHYWLLSLVWLVPILEVDNTYYRIICIVAMIVNFLQIISAYNINNRKDDFE